MQVSGKPLPPRLAVGQAGWYHIKANSAVAQSLFKKATGDGPQSVAAAIFWAKTRMGWKETVVNEHGGVAHNPIRVIRRIIVSPPDREKLRATPGPVSR